MKVITKKKETKVKQKASKICVLSNSLYVWLKEADKAGLLKDDPFLNEVIHYDIEKLHKEANNLFWDEL